VTWILRSGHFMRSNILKMRVVTIKLLLQDTKIHIAYGMILCLVLLTDL